MMRHVKAREVGRVLTVVTLALVCFGTSFLFSTSAWAQSRLWTTPFVGPSCGEVAFDSVGNVFMAGPRGPVFPIPDTLWLPAAGTVPANGNYVYLESDPGDYIGQGQAYLYVPSTAVITVSAAGGLLSVGVRGDEQWSGKFQVMNTLTDLEPGYYPGLQRYPFHNPTQGGLDWYGEGRGSNNLTGWFAIDGVTYAEGVLTAIDLRFELHSEGGTPALHGAIRWAAGATSSQTATNLALTAPSVCKYGSAKLSGSLKAVDTSPLANATVTIRCTTGGPWTTAGFATTNVSGAYTFTAAPATIVMYQVIFPGDDTHAGSTSTNPVTLPGVFLSRPTAPTSTRTVTKFTCRCDLKPRHAAGSHPVTFVCQRRVSGRWVTVKTVKARAANFSTYTRCSASIRLTTKGWWRICGVHLQDSLNAATVSAWRSVKVT
jgi:hypothetical protein